MDAQDYQVALDGFLLGGRPSQWSEFADNTFQAFRPFGIGDDDLVASADEVAGDGLADIAGADEAYSHDVSPLRTRSIPDL